MKFIKLLFDFLLLFSLIVAPLRAGGPAAYPRVMLIGLDAAEWDVIDPLIAEKKLPAVARLKAKGVAGPLESIEPTISPALWTTAVTGKRRAKHGITSFTVKSKDGGEVPVTGNFRAVKALWNILSEKGLRTGFVNWWPSYPAEAVNGFMVSNYMRYYYPQLFLHGEKAEEPLDEVKRIAYPEELEPLVRSGRVGESKFLKTLDLEKIEKHRLKGAYDPTFKVKFKDNIKIFQHAVREDELVKETALKLLDKYPVDLFGVYFEGIDVVSHVFWKYSRPDEFEVGPEEAKDLGGILEAYYEFSDGMVGELLAKASPETNVIISSDHGYGKVGEGKDFHRLNGIIILAGPAFREGASLKGASILDLTPTILYLLGLPVAKDMEGKVLLEAFREDFRKEQPVRWVESYEEAGEKKEPAEAVVTPLDDATREKLRTLGYIK